MELQNIAVLGISGATLVTIIVAIASSRGLASDWKPAASALAGMFVVGLYEVTQVWPGLDPAGGSGGWWAAPGCGRVGYLLPHEGGAEGQGEGQHQRHRGC
jgi:hypothetical protein